MPFSKPFRQLAGLMLAALVGSVPASVAQQSLSRGAALPTVNPSQLPKEIFDYSIEWKLINAGTAKMSFSPLPHSGPSSATLPAGEIRLHLESSGLVSKFVRVSDDYTAMLGQNLCGQSTFLSTHEGSRSKETKVTYDSKAKKASYQEKDLTKKTTAVHDVEIPPCAYDVLGGLMVLRNLNLEPGKSTTMPVSDGKKTIWAKVEAQRREEIKTPQGMQKATVYEVFLFNNQLYRRQGHLHVWLSDDKRHVPLQIQIRLQFTIGTITFKLEKEEKS